MKWRLKVRCQRPLFAKKSFDCLWNTLIPNMDDEQLGLSHESLLLDSGFLGVAAWMCWIRTCHCSFVKPSRLVRLAAHFEKLWGRLWESAYLMHEFCHCQRAPSSCFPSGGQVWIDWEWWWGRRWWSRHCQKGNRCRILKRVTSVPESEVTYWTGKQFYTLCPSGLFKVLEP